MTYIALLRGINVGGNKKVDMKKLKLLFETLGCTDVVTYLNSGNVIFKSKKTGQVIQKEISKKIKQEFGFEVPTLIKTSQEVKKIAIAIPKEWNNDADRKTDIAYLFPEIDSKKILEDFDVKKEFITLKYVKGALIWHVSRKEYNKSQLNKILAKKLYKQLTIRNVNTARRIAQIAKDL